MSEENLKKFLQQIADATRELFNRIKNFANVLMETFKLDDPNFRHNYEMANSSKKKRTRKKYAKKCIKLDKI